MHVRLPVHMSFTCVSERRSAMRGDFLKGRATALAFTCVYKAYKACKDASYAIYTRVNAGDNCGATL